MPRSDSPTLLSRASPAPRGSVHLAAAAYAPSPVTPAGGAGRPQSAARTARAAGSAERPPFGVPPPPTAQSRPPLSALRGGAPPPLEGTPPQFAGTGFLGPASWATTRAGSATAPPVGRPGSASARARAYADSLAGGGRFGRAARAQPLPTPPRPGTAAAPARAGWGVAGSGGFGFEGGRVRPLTAPQPPRAGPSRRDALVAAAGAPSPRGEAVRVASVRRPLLGFRSSPHRTAPPDAEACAAAPVTRTGWAHDWRRGVAGGGAPPVASPLRLLRPSSAASPPRDAATPPRGGVRPACVAPRSPLGAPLVPRLHADAPSAPLPPHSASPATPVGGGAAPSPGWAAPPELDEWGLPNVAPSAAAAATATRASRAAAAGARAASFASPRGDGRAGAPSSPSPVAAVCPPPGGGGAPGYSLGVVVGQGGFCKVRVGCHLLSGSRVAVKVIDKRALTDANDRRRVGREVRVLRRLQSSSIIALFDVVVAPHHIYVVMEYAAGGSLLDHVRAAGRLGEPEACRLFGQLLRGVAFCHAAGVIHRDVKLENALLDGRGDVKLIDFGLAALVPSLSTLLRVHCGSPSYAAPEIVARKPYAGPPVDVWSCGVVLFASVAGYLPFHAPPGAKAELSAKILKGAFSLPDWVSPPCVHLLRSMLVVDPQQRVDVAGCDAHPWVRGCGGGEGGAPPAPPAPPFDAVGSAQSLLRGPPGGCGARPTEASLDGARLARLEAAGVPRDALVADLIAGEANYLTAAYHLDAAAQRGEEAQPPAQAPNSPAPPPASPHAQQHRVSLRRGSHSGRGSGSGDSPGEAPNGGAHSSAVFPPALQLPSEASASAAEGEESAAAAELRNEEDAGDASDGTASPHVDVPVANGHDTPSRINGRGEGGASTRVSGSGSTPSTSRLSSGMQKAGFSTPSTPSSAQAVTATG